MELEHLEVRILESLHELGPPQVENLCLHTDAAAAIYANGLMVAYRELIELSHLVRGLPWLYGLRRIIGERNATIFELYQRLVKREAVMAALKRPLMFTRDSDDSELLRELLAADIAFTWREISRDNLPLDGEPNRELENSRLEPHLDFLDGLVQEAQKEICEQRTV